jgi:OmpA-OmpF porin, OOP family
MKDQCRILNETNERVVTYACKFKKYARNHLNTSIMKKIVILFALCFVFENAYNQIDIKNKLKTKTIRKADNNIDKAIDKGLDKTEEGIKDVFKKDKDDDTADNEQMQNSPSENVSTKSDTGPDAESRDSDHAHELSWSKYDFVPGNKIIFEDNQEGEENGEFPSRWDLVKGRVENAVFDSSNVIYFMTASSQIIPYLKNREEDYIPEEFTLEFDAWFKAHEYTFYEIWFSDLKNQRNKAEKLVYSILRISANQAINNRNKGMYPGSDDGWNNKKSYWRHVSISFNRRALKVYLDDARVLNVPNMEINPMGLTIGIDNFGTAGVKGSGRYIKNIRLAEGAVKLYDKLLQDGKIVSNGIRFDVGKATIRPESMGVINKIYALMNEHPEINFSVEGHTDNDGSDDLNQELSVQRAEAVVKQLVAMGISKDRLTSKGFGESVPVASNESPEGKASNRRVEFIKN